MTWTKLPQTSAFIWSLLPFWHDAFRDIRADRFAFAVLLEFVVFIPMTWLAVGCGQYVMITGANTELLHVLYVQTHRGQSLYRRRYTPCVATARS
ncbi:hypothetical protein ACFFSY_17285 [Paenibacillus aurantiacus]|uniref:Uncharacterized protein n=1 Tax=Paenibacillus aurantiacus TaxID=1936118 RepID=A0ABV5KR24_9BACL